MKNILIGLVLILSFISSNVFAEELPVAIHLSGLSPTALPSQKSSNAITDNASSAVGTKQRTDKSQKMNANNEMIKIPMYTIAATGKGKFLGYVIFKDSPYGLLIYPSLKNLRPGLRAFHIATNPSCDQYGAAAGGHLDPRFTRKHLGPYGDGHLGDLPGLYVDEDGESSLPLLAPRLKLSDLYDHAVLIHAGSDNYSDYPRKQGGEGTRVACGVIHKY